jgi:hypothetical protein
VYRNPWPLITIDLSEISKYVFTLGHTKAGSLRRGVKIQIMGCPTRLEPSLPSAPMGPLMYRLCVCQCALLLGQGGHEPAAEVGNVGDNAAPDQVRSG